MKTVLPGSVSAISVLQNKLAVDTAVDRFKNMLLAVEPQFHAIAIHNETKSAHITVSFVNKVMHIHVINDQEAFEEFKFRKDNNGTSDQGQQKEQKGEATPDRSGTNKEGL